MLRLSLVAVALAAAMSTGGCAPAFERMDGDALSDLHAPTKVRVANHNWLDVNVYVVRGGMRHRLGTVGSMNQSNFTIPESMLTGSGDVRLVIDPIGSSNTFTTAPILVGPGQSVDLRLENNLQLSSLSVW